MFFSKHVELPNDIAVCKDMVLSECASLTGVMGRPRKWIAIANDLRGIN